MHLSELTLTLALAHPGVAFILAGLFVFVWLIDRRMRYLAFCLSYLSYGVGVAAQILMIPANVAANTILTGFLYSGAVLLMYGGLLSIQKVKPLLCVVGLATAGLFVARYYFSVISSRPLHGRLLENKFLACERSKRLQPYIRPVDAGV